MTTTFRLGAFGAILSALLLAGAHSASAQTGTAGMTFLKFGAGGRSIAMGDAAVASAVSGATLYYNPALAGTEKQSSLLAMYQSYIQDIATSYCGAIASLDGWSLGFHFNLTTVKDIEVRDVPGLPIGMFDTQNFSTGITAAVPLGDGVSAGVTMKYLFEKIYVDNAGGFAVDAGVYWKPGLSGPLNTLALGASLSNLGSMSVLRTEATKLPTILRYGASWVAPIDAIRGGMQAELDGVSYLQESVNRIHVGVEFEYEQSLFLRGGYQFPYHGFLKGDRDVRGFTAGFGAAYDALRIDYAFVPFRDNYGTAHAVSVSILF